MLCPSCNSSASRSFYSLARIPTSSNVVFRSRDEALNAPTGSLDLHFCETCGFIWNAAFDPTTQHAGEYEATQGCSPTFNKFARELAARWIEKHHLRGKALLEIGCLNGEFITQLCAMANTTGVGIDPELNLARVPADSIGRVDFIKDFYGPKYAHLPADFICCRHTLEHVPDVGRFIADLRAAVDDRPATTVCFEVPGTERVLDECAFWDIYYEHCSYFTAETLAGLFQRNRFEVLNQRTEFDGQYLTIDTRATNDSQLNDYDVNAIRGRVAAFVAKVHAATVAFREMIAQADGKVVLWGSGSKAVGFLSTLGLGTDAVAEVVDINPAKHGTYLAMTGQEVVPAERLVATKPSLVIGMNPAYRNEIAAVVAGLSPAPQLTFLGEKESRTK